MKISQKSLWALFLSSLTISQGQTSLTDQNIHSAVLLWFSNEQAARDTYGDINNWDTSQVTDFSQLFASKSMFDDDISNWDTSAVTTMSYMFNGANEFNQPIGLWNVSQVTSFDFFLGGASTFNQDLSLWKPEKATSMSFMFMGARSFNGNIGAWGVSSVEYFNGMFFGAKAFDRYIGTWDVSTAISFASMFYGATSFNKDISQWNTDNIVNMDLMFMRATSFNQPLSDWTVSNVSTMKRTFSTASAFNQDLSDWDVTSVTDMSGIFDDAISFEQTICWDLGSALNLKDVFCGSQGSFDTTCIRGLINDTSRSSCPKTVSPTITSVPTTTVPPSVLPSISPTISSTISPTSSPSVAPSQAPDESKTCAVDDNGSYGMSNGESNLVEYNYEMRTSKSITGSQATYVMDLLEPAITNLIIEAFFTDCTAQAKRRLSSFLGLTTAPTDQILNHVGCTEDTESNTESCYVVRGELTIYSLFGEDVNATLETMSQAIKFTMDSGEFDFQTNDGIDVRTTYRDASSIPSARGVDVNNTGGDDDNNLNWVWAVVGVTGGLFLMYGGVRILKRRADNIRIETEESVFTEVAKPSTQSYRTSKQYDDDNAAFPHVRTKDTDIEEAEIFQDEPVYEEREGDSSSDSDSSVSSSSSSTSSSDDDDSDDSDDSDAEPDDYGFDESRSAEFATKFRAKLSERTFVDENNINDNNGQPQLQPPMMPTRGEEQIRNASLGDQQVASRSSSLVTSRIGDFEAKLSASGNQSVEPSGSTSAADGVSSKIGNFEAQIAAAGNHHQVVEPSGSGDSNFKTQIEEAASKSHPSTAFEV